jgi:hypothetical protein
MDLWLILLVTHQFFKNPTHYQTYQVLLKKQVGCKNVVSCIPKDKDNTYLLTFMDNIILRVLKLNVKVNPLYIRNLIRIWMRELTLKQSHGH